MILTFCRDQFSLGWIPQSVQLDHKGLYIFSIYSSIQDSPQPRSRPGSVFESGISRHQADKYIVLSHTSAAYDPSNAHQ